MCIFGQRPRDQCIVKVVYISLLLYNKTKVVSIREEGVRSKSGERRGWGVVHQCFLRNQTYFY